MRKKQAMSGLEHRFRLNRGEDEMHSHKKNVIHPTGSTYVKVLHQLLPKRLALRRREPVRAMLISRLLYLRICQTFVCVLGHGDSRCPAVLDQVTLEATQLNFKSRTMNSTSVTVKHEKGAAVPCCATLMEMVQHRRLTM